MPLQHLTHSLMRTRTVVSLAIITAASNSYAGTVAVNCPTQSINSAITTYFGGNGLPAVSLEKLTINVSGTCTENVIVPPFKEIELIGVSNAILRPKVTSLPVLHVQGRGLIRNFTVFSSGVVGFPRGLIQTGAYGFLRIESATVVSATADILVQAYHTSELEIRNSFISGGVSAAVEISNNAHAFIYAADGGSTVIRTSTAGHAIACYQANLTVWAIGATSSIVIGPARNGINADNCRGRVGGFDEEAGFVRITGATDFGINANVGDSFAIYQTLFSGNPGGAVRLNNGSMRIGTSSIGNNGSGVLAESGATIVFENNYGPNTVYQNVDPYNCYQGGRVYADPGDITGAVSDNCLTIGDDD
jgi:hypothetical protein